jgi:electron transport complex protein RnfB
MRQQRPQAFDPARFAPEHGLLARIDESVCIGCTLCIAACPVDAIVGAAKRMHTVLAERCIGCELCLPPCPVDCIELLPTGRPWTEADAQRTRSLFAQREKRLAGPAPSPAMAAETATARRRAAITAALSRARARRGRRAP